MEGKMSTLVRLVLLLFAPLAFESYAQESARENLQKDVGQMTLRKTVRAREYQGREVEGEDRVVGPGDSVWRMLVQEKGVPEKRFSQYLVIIRGLNPQIKNLDVLKVGETVFVPLRPEELLGHQPASATKEVARAPIVRGTTKDYRVRSGDRLYQILREQLGIQSERELAVHYALIKDLNPEKKNWDVLQEGELIRLPVPAQTPEVARAQTKAAEVPKPAPEVAPTQPKVAEALKPAPEVAQAQPKVAEAVKPAPEVAQAQPKVAEALKPAPEVAQTQPKVAEAVKPAPTPKVPQKTAPQGIESTTVQEARPGIQVPTVKEPTPRVRVGPDYAQQVPARQNVALLTRVVEALGNEVQRGGQQVFSLKDGTVRLDTDSFPVVSNPKLRQKVILDLEESIPGSLRSKLADPSVATPVLPVGKTASLQAAVGQLLAGLGYQPLPGDRPVVISDRGVVLEAKGSWTVLAPEESGKVQEVFVISLSERDDEIPDYLRTALAEKGLHLLDVALPAASQPARDGPNELKDIKLTVKHWPLDKKEFIDAMLVSLGVPFAAAETLTVELRQGLRMEVKSDRVFEANGKRTALVFQRIEPEIKKALEERQGLSIRELDIAAISRKEILARLLAEIGEQATYREHRFAAATGSNKERLTIAAWGFLLANRGMFVTDREIPQSFHRFFFEKGLEIVYFQ
jgi:hypothetical protein